MDYFNELLIHDHFGAIIFEIIEEERRKAHANGTVTWYDLEFKRGPNVSNIQMCQLEIDSSGDIFEKLMRAFNINGKVFTRHGEVVDEDYLENLNTEKKGRKCWSCGSREPTLLVCKQCHHARFLLFIFFLNLQTINLAIKFTFVFQVL